jgi:hypothetical protein
MLRKVLMLVTLAVLFAGCSAGPKAEITSAKYVETINAGGVSYHFEGQDNIEIKLDFRFDENLSAGLDPESENYRDEIFSILVKGAHFYYEDQEVERIYGYWPEEAGSNYVKEMTLFYVVPSDHSADSMRFVYDGSVLGEGGAGIDTVLKPDR